MRTSQPFSLLPPHVPALFTPPHLFLCLSSQSILSLLPIVFFFFCYLTLHSSFSLLLRGAALLSIFIMRPGKKADRNITGQKGAAIPLPTITTLWILSSPLPCFLVSLAFNSTFYSSIFNSESPTISHCISKCFHFSPLDVFDPLHLSRSHLLFQSFTALNLFPAFFSLTPTTICSFFSL